MICAPCREGKHTRCRGKGKDDACTCQHRKDARKVPTLDESRLRHIALSSDLPPVDC